MTERRIRTGAAFGDFDMTLGERALEHVRNPRNRGRLEGATHCGTSGEPGEGGFVRMWLRIEHGLVSAASYETHGCPSSVACASVLCELAKGREPERVLSLSPQELVLVLGGVPEGKERFAAMALEAFAEAVRKEND